MITTAMEDADEGYDTNTSTSNCKKRPTDPPGSPSNSTPVFLDLTLDTQPAAGHSSYH